MRWEGRRHGRHTSTVGSDQGAQLETRSRAFARRGGRYPARRQARMRPLMAERDTYAYVCQARREARSDGRRRSTFQYGARRLTKKMMRARWAKGTGALHCGRGVPTTMPDGHLALAHRTTGPAPPPLTTARGVRNSTDSARTSSMRAGWVACISAWGEYVDIAPLRWPRTGAYAA